MRTIARTILGALMAVIGTATPRRQPSAPVLQIKSRNLYQAATGLMPLPPGLTPVTVDNAAVREQVITQGIKKAGDQLIAAHEAYELERKQMDARRRKHRARKRKQKRGY